MRVQQNAISVAVQGREVDAIRITGTSNAPAEAALVANLFAEAYVERTTEASRASLTATREFLEEQVEVNAEDLREREQMVEAFMVREGAIDLGEEASGLVEQLSELQASRDEADILLRIQRARAAELRRDLDEIEPRIAERISSGVDRDLSQVQRQIAAIEALLDPIYARNPDQRTSPSQDVIDRERELNRLRAQEQRLAERLFSESIAAGGLDVGGASGSGIETLAERERSYRDLLIEIGGLEARSSALNQRIRSYEGELQSIPGQSIEFAQLTRNRLTSERLAQGLAQRLQEARIAEESELGYAEIIRPAFVPGLPVGPDRRRLVVLGVLLGLGLGVSLAYARVKMDRRLHGPDDLRERGITVLGTIPDMTELVKKDFNDADTVVVDGQHLDTRLVTLLNPLSTASEAYRSLRTNLRFSRADVELRTMAITSASPSEGKSTTTANLAIAMAQTGQRVLLIDADLRKPTAHRKFGLKREPGLVDALFSNSPPDEASLATNIDNFFVLTAGARAPNPAELLGSRAMRSLLTSLLTTFDTILIDCPPVLAATDAALISTYVDAVALVVRAGDTRDYMLDQALETLHSVRSPIVGAVLNGFDASRTYGYGYKYYRYSNYQSLYAYGADGTKETTSL